MSLESDKIFRSISEVSDLVDIPAHVLRFWETKFPQIKPMKRAGGRRYYRPEDVKLIQEIRNLLYQRGYTIKGAQKLLKGHSVDQVLAHLSSQPSHKQTEFQVVSVEDIPVNVYQELRKVLEDLSQVRHAVKETLEDVS